MQKQMNGTLLDEGFMEYSDEQDLSKQSAQPVRNYTHVISCIHLAKSFGIP